MTEKRFSKCKDMWKVFDWETGETLNFKEIINLLNELAEENLSLKEKEKDMLNYLKREYDYVYNQKRKHFDDVILVTSYELINYHIKSMIEHLERL